MATRSRRSGAGSDTLNPAMIYLLGTGRLKKELEQRGLDITGNKNLLADRLQQAVDLERMGHHSYSPPPVTEKCPRKTATKRTAKAKAQVEVSENEVLADESEPVITSPQAKKKKVDQSEAERIEEIEIVEESFSIEFSDETSTDLNAVAGVSSLPSEKPADLEAPVNNTKKSQSKSKKTSPTRKKPSTKKSSHQRLSKDDSTEAPAAHRTRRSSEEMKLEIAEENESTDSTDSEQEEQLGLKLKIDMKNKKIEKEKSVTKVRKEKEAEKNCSAENESNDSKPKKGLVLKLKLDLNKSIRMSESEPKKAPPSVLIKTVTVDSDSETSKAASGSERSSAKEEGESSKLVIKLPSDRSCGSASPLSQISPSNSSTDMSKGKQQSSESGAVDKSKVLSSDAEKKKASLSRKKIPLRMQAPIDVLDSIFDKQTELLSSKFKTEQEKADERQKIEMEKRRLSGASNIGLGPMIDRRKYPLTSQQHQPSQHHSPISPRFSTHPQKNRSLSDDRMQQLSRLPAPPPPPNLSSLPPPPPPPPALPPSRLPPPPPPPKPTYANVTPIEDALLSPLSRPPSVPPYSSPTPASASIKHYPDVPSTSAIASQLSSSDLSPDRIKEMASALQAVFARIGDANSMKLPISNDDDAAVNDYSFDSLQLSSSSFLQQHADRRLDELRTSSDLAETEAETPNSDSIVDDAKVEPSSSNVFIPPPAATHLIPLPQTEPTANLLTSNILEVIPLPDDVDRQRSPPNELISMPVVSAPITTPIDTSLSNYQSDESKPMSTANVTKQQTVQSTAVIDHNISVDSDECAISKPNSDDEIRRDVSTTLNSVLQMASGSGETKLTPLALNEDVNMTDETRAQSSDELPIPSSSCEMSQLEKDVRSILMEVVATVVASYELLSFNENVLHFSSSNSSEEEHPKENISDEASISPNTVSTDQDKESTNDSTANSTSKEPGTESKPDICEKLLRDPRLLLQKASAVLKNLTSQENVNEEHGQHYEQITPDPDYEIPEEDKPLPEFHGEPVPDSDDDIIIEGVSKRKSNAAKKNSVQEEEPIPGDEHVELDFYNADLHIKASETDRMIIDPDNGDGFALMWGGVRSTYGIRVPRQFDDSFPVTVFQAKVLEHLTMKHIPFEEVDAYDARIGWSLQNTQTILGESAHSYSFSLTARKALGNVFTDYGEPFQIGDIITTAVDLAKGEISYWINKQWMGVAFSEVHLMPDEALFPHICTKNCKVAVNFGNSKADDWIDLSELNRDNSKQEQQQQKLTFIDHVSKDKLVRGPVAPSSKNECTVLMMVGLPGVGKTTWVRQYLKDHPHEQWTLISTDVILAAMKINGVARSRVHQGRWDMVMGLTAKALTRSLHLACRRRRNYIIDQTNVSKDARRKKLSQFKDFQRKCVVIIPKEEEMLNRQIRQSRADGFGQIPVEAMLELKATFTIPNIETEPIEDVYFVEPPIERISDAIEIVRRFNEEARPWCQKKRGRRGGGGGGGDNRRSYGSRSNENRQFSFNSNRRHSSDSAAPKQSSHAQPRPKEGYCGFGGAMPPSMVPTSTLWAEHKSTSN